MAKKKWKKGEEMKKCYFCKFDVTDTCKNPQKRIDYVCEKFKWCSSSKSN